MSYTEDDARSDAYYDDLRRQFEEDLKGQATASAKAYLGRYGDAIDQRVKASLAEANALLKSGYLGPALCAAAISIELMIRFMLLRPLIQGAFLSDEWAEILTTRVVSGRIGDDRELVPAVLRQWGLDVTIVRGPVSGIHVWEFTVGRLFPGRHNYVHRFEPVPMDLAVGGAECAEAFRTRIVNAVATKLGFTVDTTGQWCRIVHSKLETLGMITSEWIEDFTPEDPFSAPVGPPRRRPDVVN